ncbi:hypothetical protein M422DRAFT_249379 [Sphaerobolus stellatus SS14]|uniref:Uncharacterized protein n=1 Tax=Sphaerobolus stellatus (strain SS14) TaxID=990650 RepID=A0A0C9W5J7_SPHS4|nr:hypothetical protein M422DRAFT_249379 [Sphaerobolus stellatus SS14]
MRVISLQTLYLSLIAKEIYFKAGNFTATAVTKTSLPRLFIIDLPAHILSIGLFVFAILAGFIHLRHRQIRRDVMLPFQPGTLAAAAAITANSNVSQLLGANLDEKALKEALRAKRFTMDKETGKVVMEQGRQSVWVPFSRMNSVRALLS